MPELNEMLQAIENIRNEQTPQYLEKIKIELKKFFPEVNFIDVLYTNNTDNMPFGIMVAPILYPEMVRKLLIDGEEAKITSCIIEIDSKVFSSGLDNDEILAIMLYNIYHLTADTTPCERLREAIDAYFVENKSQLRIKESVQYQKILEFGLVDTLIKFTNCLYLDSIVLNDAYLVSVGLDGTFTSALSKLFHKYADYTNDASRFPTLIILDWCFKLYNDVEHQRIPAKKQLERSKELTASVLYKRCINAAIDSLTKIDTDSMLIESAIQRVYTEAKKGSIFAQIKYNGLRGIEDDFYEFVVRARNAQTEEEVMYALKQINVRLSILDDYIRNENLDDAEKQRWTNLYIKYCNIRDDIANKKVYNKKNYGIFFDYNQLDRMYADEEDDDY